MTQREFHQGCRWRRRRILGLECQRDDAFRGHTDRVQTPSWWCVYSYRPYLEKKQMTMEDFILKAWTGNPGRGHHDLLVDVHEARAPGRLAASRLPEWRAVVRRGYRHQHVSARCRQAQGGTREEQTLVDATEFLGAAHLRVFGGEASARASEEQGIQWVVETMKPACDYAFSKGIILGIESHGGSPPRPPTSWRFAPGRLPYAGCNLDISNFQ